jgi:enoyl-[acyl-carrier protein] reductase II
MKTRLTQLLGIQHPIVLPGMTYIAVPSLVAAVCNAGGLGILASGALSPEECRAAIREVRRLTDKPFGVGCSLMLPGAAECARVALEEQVPVINVSMGKGEWVIEGARAYGGKVIATISVLIPAVRDMTDLPIIAAGGIADGRGLVAALALGADAVAMGTRFATSLESPVHAETKRLIVSQEAEATIYSSNFDTFPCRVMKTPGGRKYTARRLSPPVAISRSLAAARELNTPLISLAKDAMGQGLTGAVKVAYFGAATLAMRKAIQDANHDEGVQLIGQSQGLVRDVVTVQEIVDRVMREAREAARRLQGLAT